MKPRTERSYHECIARAIETILANPAAPHTLDSLASVARLSPFHFHRIYRAITGERIARTVRRVRLAQAARRLVSSVDSVTEISLVAGYESSQAFARAFRKFTGLSPSEFQSRQDRLAMSTAAVPTAGNLPPVTLIEMPAVTALCLRHDGPLDTIAHTFQRLLRTFCGDTESPIIDATIGICSGDPDKEGTFSYLAGVVPAVPIELAPASGPSRASGWAGALELMRIAGGLYATHRVVGPYALIAPTFRTLFRSWLPGSGYEFDDRHTVEIYRNLPWTGATHECITDLMIPVRHRHDAL